MKPPSSDEFIELELSPKKMAATSEGCAVCGNVHGPNDDHSFNVHDDEIDEELLDPVSLVPIYDGVQFPTTKCSHSFSRFTIERCLRSKSECPLCKSHITLADMKPVTLMVKNILDKLKVHCPHDARHEHGCFKRCELPQHLSHCPTAPISCPIEFQGRKCMNVVKRGEMSAHMDICDLRSVVCSNGCESTICARDVPQHNCISFLKMQLADARKVSQERLAAMAKQLETSQSELTRLRELHGSCRPGKGKSTVTPSHASPAHASPAVDLSVLPTVTAHQLEQHPLGVFVFASWSFALCRANGPSSTMTRPADVMYLWAHGEDGLRSVGLMLGSIGWFNVHSSQAPYRFISRGDGSFRDDSSTRYRFAPDPIVAIPPVAILRTSCTVTFGNWRVAFQPQEIVVSNTQHDDNTCRLLLRCDEANSVCYEPSATDPFRPV